MQVTRSQLEAMGVVATAVGAMEVEAMEAEATGMVAEADMVAATAADMVATTVRVTGLAAAFRCRCPSLVAGKLAA